MDTYSIYPKQFNTSEHRFQYDTCFVIMPFSHELDNTYTVIESVAESLNIKCTRADTVSTTSEPMLNKIFTQINQSYFVIVDITNLNPNVFYELGIAHVLREASKVLIIKEEDTQCPSDISHIHYYEYNNFDLRKLRDTIKTFFNENNVAGDLRSILDFHGLLSNDEEVSEKFINSLINISMSNMECMIKILSNQLSDIKDEPTLSLLQSLSAESNKMQQTSEMYLLYSQLVSFIIQKTYSVCDIRPYVSQLLENRFDCLSKEWVADCCMKILDDSLYVELVMKWVITYLKHVSPAEFDIVKYKIEIGLIKTTEKQVDDFLIKYLNSSNKTLAEHCAKIIKERNTTAAIPVLMELLLSEKNPYVFRSCLDALIKIASLDILLQAKEVIAQRNDYVQSYDFFQKHLSDLNNRIDSLQ